MRDSGREEESKETKEGQGMKTESHQLRKNGSQGIKEDGSKENRWKKRGGKTM